MAWSRTPQDIAFTTFDLDWGFLALRPVDVRTDVTLLRRWLLDPGTGSLPSNRNTRVRGLLEAMLREPERQVFLGFRDDVPAFLFETFPSEHEAAHDSLGARRGAVGVRVLACPAAGEDPGLAAAVLRTIARMVFAAPDADRVVLEAEPAQDRDVRVAAGFHDERLVTARGEEIHLSTRARSDELAAPGLRAAG
ncbi:GNAT family N-acetyltransferase [Saccharopolyspora sp. MS10]|uniref:GNAT family N-acetyltransferase n=1 Tax=Saccharopolyspora sp. MS10 TaxID=3385973 RepID=UPI0039A02C8B